MTREEKNAIVQDLVAQLHAAPNVYVTDAGGLTVAQSMTFAACPSRQASR
jgi:ribosomal protein L10